MDNSSGIPPVGAVPTVTPVNQRRPRQQQPEAKKPQAAQEQPDREETKRDNEDKGLDCYA